MITAVTYCYYYDAYTIANTAVICTIIACRNRIKKPWAYDPKVVGFILRNPNKGPRFLNQVPTLSDVLEQMLQYSEDHVPFKGTIGFYNRVPYRVP